MIKRLTFHYLGAAKDTILSVGMEGTPSELMKKLSAALQLAGDFISRKEPIPYRVIQGALGEIENNQQFYLSKIENRKAQAFDFEGRFIEILADPNNKYIERVSDSGKFKDNHVVMHNGLKVLIGSHSYYGSFSNILHLNRGVHEPQEERVFQEVLKYMPEGAVMIELGSYWSFYSMWFQNYVTEAKNYLVEPDEEKLEIGKKNFRLNGMQGDFTQGFISEEGIKLDDYIQDKGINTVNLLHVDIQGYEQQMLLGAKKAIYAGRIHYVFISSHSQELHYWCLDFLKKSGYFIIASADFDNETYCHDGVIVGRLNDIKGPGQIRLEVRNPGEKLSIDY